MTVRNLYCVITGISGTIYSVNIDMSYSQISNVATIECDTTTLVLGSSLTIDMGYTDEHQLVFTGYVKKIEWVKPEQKYRITAYDRLIRAIDYFIAADDPSNPLTFNSISSFNLVKGLLAECGITTNITGTEPGFTWGTNPDGARFNLQTVADAIQFVATTTGYTIYDDGTGTIHFVQRYPYVVGGDVSSVSFADGLTGNIISCQYIQSTDKTRNKIVVYGKTPLKASARADNAYLVVDQTVVIAHDLLDVQSICDAAATINLQILNRLTESYEVDVLGIPSLAPRQIGDITESFSGAVARPIFIYRVSHALSSAGYLCTITGIP